MGVGTAQEGGVEQPGRPVVIRESGSPVDLVRTIDPGHTGSDTAAAHLLIRHLLAWILLIWILLF
jgi:hypothetical protein